jgi:hypothetical protein
MNEGRDRVLGLDVYGDETDANYPNAPALLTNWIVDTIEQRWQVVDLTPTNNVTAQYVATTRSTITPSAVTSYISSSVLTVNTTIFVSTTWV